MVRVGGPVGRDQQDPIGQVQPRLPAGTAISDRLTATCDTYRRIRARAEHALARMKCFMILRDYRRAAHTLADAVSGIAHLHNIILAG
jgi:hypothetical protein